MDTLLHLRRQIHELRREGGDARNMEIVIGDETLQRLVDSIPTAPSKERATLILGLRVVVSDTPRVAKVRVRQTPHR